MRLGLAPAPFHVVEFDVSLFQRLNLLLYVFLLQFLLPEDEQPAPESALLLVDHLHELFGPRVRLVGLIGLSQLALHQFLQFG